MGYARWHGRLQFSAGFGRERIRSGTEKHYKRFETLCQHNGIAYRVHKDFIFFAMPELKKETRFADLLIISSEKFYINLASEAPNPYLHEALNRAECPVVVVPETFRFPQRNVLAYDGSETSLFAIKQFAYLFPELCKMKRCWCSPVPKRRYS